MHRHRQALVDCPQAKATPQILSPFIPSLKDLGFTGFSDKYDPVYNNFRRKIDDRLEAEMRRTYDSFHRRGRDFVFNSILESPLGIIFRDILIDRIKIPCLSCGEPTGGRRNHTYPRSNLVGKFISQNGHLYEFHAGTERKVISIDGQEWDSQRGSFKRRGENNVSIFYGFCRQCDHSIFKNADSEDLTDGKPKAVFQQLYRVLCSIYHEALRHTIIHQYIVEAEEKVGLRAGSHSIFTQGMNPVTGESINLLKMVQELLHESYRHYNLMQDFDFNKILTNPQHFRHGLDPFWMLLPNWSRGNCGWENVYLQPKFRLCKPHVSLHQDIIRNSATASFWWVPYE